MLSRYGRSSSILGGPQTFESDDGEIKARKSKQSFFKVAELDVDSRVRETKARGDANPSAFHESADGGETHVGQVRGGRSENK